MAQGHYQRRPSGKGSIGLHTLKTQSNSQNLQGMSKLLSTPIQAFGRNVGYTSDVAIATVGHGFGWTPSTFTKGEQICSSCSRILHNNVKDSQKVLLAKHCLPIWCTLIANSRQWKVVRLRQLQKFLQKHRHQNSLHLSVPPRVKWCCGKIQQNSLLCNLQDTIQPSQGKIDRRTPEGRVVLEHNDIQNHRLYPI
jgi:hypothetical protein